MARSLVAFVALLGCIDHGPGPQDKKIEASYVAANLRNDVPSDVAAGFADLDGQVAYAGHRIDRPVVAPGQLVRITTYWRVVKAPGPGWRVFALLRGATNTADFMNLPATDMELGHPVETWQPGEIIQDPLEFTLRPDWKSKEATLTMGLIRVGAHDAGDRMPVRASNASVASAAPVVDSAIVVAVVPVDLAKAPPPLGTVYVPHARAAIAIDGVAEPAWAGAVTSPEFTAAEGSPDPIGRATAKMTWDEDNLYVFVSVADTDIVSQYKQHDQPLWKEDVVEIFIDADSNRRGYVELQVNPNNATFDSWFQSTRQAPGDEKWDSGMETRVNLRGTTEPGDTDQGWDAEIRIPWQAVKGRDEAMNVRLPPHVGDRWRMNIVRGDVKTGAKGTEFAGVSSWNRITNGDWHALDRMLTIVFADLNGSIVPTPEQPPGAAPSPAPAPAAVPGPAPVPAPASAPGTAPPGTAHVILPLGTARVVPGDPPGSGAGSAPARP
jgi:hypothetical protein